MGSDASPSERLRRSRHPSQRLRWIIALEAELQGRRQGAEGRRGPRACFFAQDTTTGRAT